MDEVRRDQRHLLRGQVVDVPFDDVSPLAAALGERLLSAAAADPRVVGVLLGGSGGIDALDAFSDLDFVLVCEPEAHAALLAEAPTLAARLGPLLSAFTGEHVGEPRLLIALYGPPPLHVDLKLVTVAQLAERVEDGRLLWQRDGRVAEALVASPARWPEPDAQWIEDRVWVWVHYSATKLGRGELFECLDALAMLRSLALGPLLARRYGARAQGVRRLERVAPESLAALRATVGDHSHDGCVAALEATAALYRELRDDPGAAPLERRDDAEREALRYLASVRP